MTVEIIDETPIEEITEPQEVAEEVEQAAEQPVEEIDVITLADEPIAQDDAPAPKWVRELRKNYRDLQRDHRELQERLKPQPAANSAASEKPTLKGCDYDTERYEEEFKAWNKSQLEADARALKVREQEDAQRAEWQNKLKAYDEKKGALRVMDFESAESMAQEKLSALQQGIIVQYAKDPALVIYAIGKNPEKLAELSNITDPGAFAFAIADLQRDLKVMAKKSPPPPEKVIIGNARASGTVDSTLDGLRAEAERTGDYSKVVAYKNSKKRA